VQELTLVHVVDERTRPVYLDDREPLAIALLELRDAADVDLLEGERYLLPRTEQLRPGAVAERAAGRVVEDDATDTDRA
jgi:hypothetical protein